MKKLLIAALATILSMPALAATHVVPADKPIVSVVIPDKGWSVDTIARGIEVSDDDDEIYLAIEGIDGNNVTATVAAAVTFLDRQGVTIDQSTKKEKEGRLGNFPVFDLGWKGKDKDGEVLVHLTIVNITPERGILFTYYASPKGDREHDAAISAMIRSMKRIGE